MATIIEQPGYFTCLPREYYVSEEIFQTELRKVFSRQWVYAGQVSQVPNPGDFYVREVGPESLIITRDPDGHLRAFFNVCRHRGSRMCKNDTSGNAKHFTCPYHNWSYGIDGRLKGAPGARDGQDFDYADFGLHEAHCDSYFGSIYVYLADEEPPQTLSDTLSAVTSDMDRLALVEPDRTKVAARKVYDVQANWKTLVENNSECYHCPGTHASLCIAWNPIAGFQRDDGGKHALYQENPELYIPLRDGMKTFSIDGDWVCQKLLGTPQPERFSVGHILGPVFNALAYFADHGVAVIVEPVTRSHSRLVAEWLVHEDAVEGVDYDPARVMEVFDVTNVEDIELSEQNYLGVSSMRYTPGPNNARREGHIKHVLDVYLEMMEADA